jgi:hypothetical protein
MGRIGLLVVAVIVASVVIAPFAYYSVAELPIQTEPDTFYYGVTYGLPTVEGAKQLIDKVHTYTNLFIFDSSDISKNETALNEVCSYAAHKNMHFIVYFFSLFGSDWQQDWVIKANEAWPGKFLGIYLRDEPGGRQLELANIVTNASSYSEAAQSFIANVSESWSMQYLKQNQIPVFTADFAMYSFDYQAGFDCVFAELGWNGSREQQIGLCRGAATAQNKEWGTIVAWTYQQAPYFDGGAEMYQDMAGGYDAGAKYVLVFNFPQYPESNPYGVLTEEHFAAIEQFSDYVNSNPRGTEKAEAAFVLPVDYGCAMSDPLNPIWGLWPPDNNSELIWRNSFSAIDKHGLNLDIVYDDGRNWQTQYSQVYFWNQTQI